MDPLVLSLVSKIDHPAVTSRSDTPRSACYNNLNMGTGHKFLGIMEAQRKSLRILLLSPGTVLLTSGRNSRLVTQLPSSGYDPFLQVYVSVYADGPTRVLRFADEKSTALLEAEQSVLDLAARLRQARFFPLLKPPVLVFTPAIPLLTPCMLAASPPSPAPYSNCLTKGQGQ